MDVNNSNLSIEILCKNKSKISNQELISKVLGYLGTVHDNLAENTIIKFADIAYNDLNNYIESITICDDELTLPFDSTNISFFPYKSHERGPEIESFENDDSREEILLSNHWILPCRDFMGMWEHLIYEKGLKENLLKFVETTMMFANRKVDTNIVSCNRLVLLHGPPGTGKTSLCKAIAQKMSIRLNREEFKHTHFIEINCHSLFSKYFSESGKLVTKLFSKIKEILENKKSMVFLLIDEVESIAYARENVSSNEPTDSIRVVNAVLTQLDQLRHSPNILILTTSNLTSSIDLAFLDRADIKQYIGNPNCEAIYQIYSSAIQELTRTQIIKNSIQIFPYNLLGLVEDISGDVTENSAALLKVAKQSCGMSGRTLRKMPFLACALYLKAQQTILLEQFIEAMGKAVLKQLSDSIIAKDIDKNSD